MSALFCGTTLAFAQLGAPKEDVVSAKTYFSSDKLPAGKETLIMVQVDIKKGWHIYANPANPDYLYPVKLVVSSKGKIQVTKVLYPQGKDYIEPESKEVYKVYEDKIELVAKIKAPAELAGKEEDLSVIVDYQACDSKNCLTPVKHTNVFKIKVAGEGEEIKLLNQDYFNKKASH